MHRPLCGPKLFDCCLSSQDIPAAKGLGKAVAKLSLWGKGQTHWLALQRHWLEPNRQGELVKKLRFLQKETRQRRVNLSLKRSLIL